MNLVRWENLLVWGGFWLGSFCVLEGLAVWWAGCPWDTFSRTVWDLQTRWEWVTVPTVAILAILLFHLSRLAGISEGDRQRLLIRRLTNAKYKVETRRNEAHAKLRTLGEAK